MEMDDFSFTMIILFMIFQKVVDVMEAQLTFLPTQIRIEFFLKPSFTEEDKWMGLFILFCKLEGVYRNLV